MQTNILHIVTTLFFMVSSIMNDQHTFYVNPAASTSNLEIVRNQVRAANDNMTENITVILKNGTHYLDKTFKMTESDGGSNGFKVIWKAETEGQVFLSGGLSITGWTLYDTSKNIYRVQIPNGLIFRQIYINGTRRTRARTPNSDGDTNLGPYNIATGVDMAEKKMKVNVSEISNWNNLNQVEMIFYPSWYHYRLRIESYTIYKNIATITFQPAGLEQGFKKPQSYYATAPYFFENAYEFIDSEGEWYLNTTDHYLYYKPRTGENMTNVEVIVPMVETLVSIKGSNAHFKVSNISFEGIIFEHSTWTHPSSHNMVVTQSFQPQPISLGGSMDPSIRPPGAVRVDYGEAINFYNCTFRRLGANGLVYFIGDKNCEVDHNTFEKLSGNGMVVDQFNKINPNDDELSKGFKITNNTFQYVGLDFTNSVALLANFVQDFSFENNKLAHIPYTGVQIGNQSGAIEGGVKNISVSFNEISDFTKIHSDGGGIYTLGHQPNCIIKENYIHDWSRPELKESKVAPSAAIYLDNYSKYITVDHNYISGYDRSVPRTHASFVQTTTTGVSFINNETSDTCVILGAGPDNKDKGCK